MIGIGQKLQELREGQGYTHRKLEEMTGISHSFICDIEHGRSNPSIANLKILASALGVSPGIFLEEVE